MGWGLCLVGELAAGGVDEVDGEGAGGGLEEEDAVDGGVGRDGFVAELFGKVVLFEGGVGVQGV